MGLTCGGDPYREVERVEHRHNPWERRSDLQYCLSLRKEVKRRSTHDCLVQIGE